MYYTNMGDPNGAGSALELVEVDRGLEVAVALDANGDVVRGPQPDTDQRTNDGSASTIPGKRYRHRHLTLSPRTLSADMAIVRAELENGLAEAAVFAAKNRPRTRIDCLDGPRPCPWISCKFHLGVDVKDNGGLILNFPGDNSDPESPEIDLDAMPETCALDVAEDGGTAAEKIAVMLALTTQRIEQIEAAVLKRLRNSDVLRCYLDSENGE